MKMTSYISRGAMQNQSKKLDVVANNIANVNTTGYKRNIATFKTTVQQLENQVQPVRNKIVPNDNGAVISAVRRDMTEGALLGTGREGDFAINGDGMFAVMDETTMQKYYTRDGRFFADENGDLRDRQGRLVITDESLGTSKASQIVVYNVKEIDLVPMGDNFFTAKPNAQIYSNQDNPSGFGSVVEGTLEQSNVDLGAEFGEMIITHRSYSMSSKVFEVGDEITDLINNINR